MQDTTRRQFLQQASLAAAATATSHSLFAAPTVVSADPLTVRTPSGTLHGEMLSDDVRIFRGVPFAQPPVNELRFRPPQKLKPWTSTREAVKFAPGAIQAGGRDIQHSEDCLYLNVWAPTTKGPHPVFVWIHGGGFTGGYSFAADLDGSVFAREGIVCVTVAYRLGVFGFLDVEPLLHAPYVATASNGVHDLVASLEWVQHNIAAFGGDPTKVTVGGESAGAKLTDILMGVPSTRGLFHQMISESGGGERILPRAQSVIVAKSFAETWGQVTKKDIRAMVNAAPSDLLDAQQRFIQTYPQHFPLRPEVDGTFIPHLPVQTIAAGSTRGKRLLLGTNLDESAAFIGPHPVHDPTAADLGNLQLDRFTPVYERYKELYPTLNKEQLRIRAVTAEEYWVPSTRVIDAHVKGGGTAFMYRLDFAETSGRYEGYAEHSMDIPMVFSDPRKPAKPGTKAALSLQMHAAWTAFIQGKSPAADGLPEWQSYTPATRATMILNSASRVERKPHEEELRLWDGVM